MTSLIPPPSLAVLSELDPRLQQQGYAVLDAASVSALSGCPLPSSKMAAAIW
jgi:hypothetical protein